MTSDWDRAGLALALLALDPVGLGGAVIRMRAGPQRDAVRAALAPPLPRRKLPVSISDDQLFGALDLTATLAAGRPVLGKGLLSRPLCAVVPMAERCPPELAAKLAQTLDKGQHFCLICLDEGAEPDERCPTTLCERLAFYIAPEGRLPEGWQPPVPAGTVKAAALSPDQIETLVSLAAALGIDSLRAPLLAMRAAKAHARLNGRAQAIRADLDAAAALVFPHRTTRQPEELADQDEPEAAAQNEPLETQTDGNEDDIALPDEMMVEAVRALLPPDLLNHLVPAGTQRNANGTGAGTCRKSLRRGRPLPSRPGRANGQARIDILATLRAAAPWQSIRRKTAAHISAPVLIRPSDIRLKRYQERADRLLIFAVDASGSSAVSRLGEAKGAVELLLADAYASRDQVALIAFRGQGANLLLPPTRSLVQTKRRLAALPGGGATPLAAGLNEAAKLAQQCKGRGLTPTLVLLTDGRANITLDGTADRTNAQKDAETVALSFRQLGTPGLVIDTGTRPSRTLEALSGALGGPYIAMPRADAQRLQTAVSAALSA